MSPPGSPAVIAAVRSFGIFLNSPEGKIVGWINAGSAIIAPAIAAAAVKVPQAAILTADSEVRPAWRLPLPPEKGVLIVRASMPVR